MIREGETWPIEETELKQWEKQLMKMVAHHRQLLIRDSSAQLPHHHPGGVHHVGLVGGDVVGVAIKVQVH